jgi:hypothetical protein
VSQPVDFIALACDGSGRTDDVDVESSNKCPITSGAADCASSIRPADRLDQIIHLDLERVSDLLEGCCLPWLLPGLDLREEALGDPGLLGESDLCQTALLAPEGERRLGSQEFIRSAEVRNSDLPVSISRKPALPALNVSQIL